MLVIARIVATVAQRRTPARVAQFPALEKGTDPRRLGHRLTFTKVA